MAGPPDSHLVGIYPELAAGGFTRDDGTVAFYLRVNALLAESGPDAVVVDFGAGRGAFLDDLVPFRRDLRRLQGKAKRVIGIDIDDAVLRNPSLDEAHVVPEGGRLPVADGSVDLIVSDFTFEHVRDPAWVAAELDRALRPGGWVCARTPNRGGFIGLGGRVVPNRLHDTVLRHLQPAKRPEDTFPTAYRLNTRRDLERWFPPDRYDHVVYAANSEPRYVGRSPTAARLGRAAAALTPPPLRSMLRVFLHKR